MSETNVRIHLANYNISSTLLIQQQASTQGPGNCIQRYHAYHYTCSAIITKNIYLKYIHLSKNVHNYILPIETSTYRACCKLQILTASRKGVIIIAKYSHHETEPIVMQLIKTKNNEHKYLDAKKLKKVVRKINMVNKPCAPGDKREKCLQ